MKVKGISKRVLSFILALVITFSSATSGLLGVSLLSSKSDGVDKTAVTVMADSNDRRATLIHMAAGMNAQGLNDQHELSISKEELQVIGIFLSNFYKPFQTCVNATDSDVNKKLEEEEIQCLVGVGFDEEIAQYLTKAVKKASSSTATNEANKLTYQYKYTTSSDETAVPKADKIKSRKTIDASYACFVNAVVQGGQLKLGDKVIIDFGVGYNAKYQPADKIGAVDEGYDRVIPATVPGSTQLMLQHWANMLDWKNGYGTSMIYSIDDILTKKEFAETLTNVSNSDAFERIIPSGQLLYLDCFGNIVADMGTAQVVIIPACMNPYVFQVSDDSTTTVDGDTASQTTTTADGNTTGQTTTVDEEDDATALGNTTSGTHSVYNCANLQTMYGRTAVGDGKETDFNFTGTGAFYDMFFRNGNTKTNLGARWCLVPGSSSVSFTMNKSDGDKLKGANGEKLRTNDLFWAVPGFSAIYAQKKYNDGEKHTSKEPVARDTKAYIYFESTGVGLDNSRETSVLFPTWTDMHNTAFDLEAYKKEVKYPKYKDDWVSPVLFIDDPATLAEFVDENADKEETNTDTESTSEEGIDDGTDESTGEGTDETTDTSMGVSSPIVRVDAKKGSKKKKSNTSTYKTENGQNANIEWVDPTPNKDVTNGGNDYHGTVTIDGAVFTVPYPSPENYQYMAQNPEAYTKKYADVVSAAIKAYKKDVGDKKFNKLKKSGKLVNAVSKYKFMYIKTKEKVSLNAESWFSSYALKSYTDEKMYDLENNGGKYKDENATGTDKELQDAGSTVTNNNDTATTVSQNGRDTTPAIETIQGSVNQDGSINFTYKNIYGLTYNNYITVSLESSKDDFYSNLQSGGSAYSIYIFLAYVYGYANYKNNTFDIQHIPYQLNLGNLPDVDVGNVFNGLEIDNTSQLTLEVLSLAKYWMHPKEGKGVITTWVHNKVSAILVSIHEKVMGNNLGNVSTGTSKYLSFSGYVTMPELDDLSWTSAILNKYDSMSVFIVILIFVVLLGYSMIGRIDVFKAVLNTIIFAFCLALPPVLIDGSIAITNKVSDSMYGSKFMYWGLTQHESYISDMNEAADNNDYDSYINTVFKKRVQDTSATNYGSSVRLKWMCPKKDNYIKNIKEQVANDTGSKLFGNIVGAMSNKAGITAEEYTDDNNALYLYRSYTDIANYSRYTYLTTAKTTGTELSSLDGDTFGDYRNTYVNYVGNKYNEPTSAINGVLAESENNGFNYKPLSGDLGLRVKLFNSNVQINTLANSYSSVDKILNTANLSTFMGVPTSSFKTLAEIRSTDTPNSQDAALNAYSQLSESPFYYFSWNLYDQGMNAQDNDATEGFKCLVLNESMTNANSVSSSDTDTETSEQVTSETTTEAVTEADKVVDVGDKTNDGYFYNMTSNKAVMKTEAWGEMRDYMDMKSLFTVVIPYLKSLNDAVLNYDTAFGLKTYDGYSYSPEDSSNYTESQDQKLYWQNVCTAQMFNMYTPWVDTMYDCKYAKGEYINYLGHKIYITDPLNPESYIKAEVEKNVSTRPMIFSVSEMKYYGLSEKDLTTVETKILAVEKNAYKELYKLMNYYTFHDSVINSAAAMIETFEFNKEFSQDTLIGNSYVLYPQAYELKNFSYDAFLRLILSQSTGEELMASNSEGSIYERVVENSNLFCGIFLLVNDVICCWLVPLAKFAFLVLVFVLSLVMLLATVIKLEVDDMRKAISQNLILPLSQFLLYTIGHAWLINCFMSEGNTAVTGATQTTITLGDPTLTVILMSIVNGLLVVLFFNIVIKLLRSTVKYVKAVGSDLASMGGGVLGGVLAGVGNSVGGFTSGVGNIVGGVGKGALIGAGAAAAGMAIGAGKLAGKVVDKITPAKIKKKDTSKSNGKNSIDEKIKNAGEIGDGMGKKTKAQTDKEEAMRQVTEAREKRKHDETQRTKVRREQEQVEHKQKRELDNIKHARKNSMGGLERVNGESDAKFRQRASQVARQNYMKKNADGSLNTRDMEKFFKNSGISDRESKEMLNSIKKAYDKKHKTGVSRKNAVDVKTADRTTNNGIKLKVVNGGANNTRKSTMKKKGAKKPNSTSKPNNNVKPFIKREK